MTIYDLTNEKIPLIRARNICLSECSFRMPQRQLISMILYLIDEAVETGFVLPRKPKSIRKAIYYGMGHYRIASDGSKAECYAETMEYFAFYVLRSVSVSYDSQGRGLAKMIINKAINTARQRIPYKQIILACHNEQIRFYEKIGFRLRDKESAPQEVRGGRTQSEWMEENISWMMLEDSNYTKEKEGNSHG